MLTLAQRVRETLKRLNDIYGYGDVKETRVFMDGRITFMVQGYGMREKLRRGHIHGDSVRALGHQRKFAAV